MNIAILTISSLSLICSAGTLLIMVKTGLELQNTKEDVEIEISDFKEKTNTSIRALGAAISNIEF